ncbi:pentatricopeptide repeat-containing protein At1g15510, chloroplastic [Typha latifolia]|uniref:pentatricopeptide repeat-containing protein At1g15510, chloroplastic n=1 Tax=Typha latifolia TaxID=4733 RepID=UPI003C2F4A96
MAAFSTKNPANPLLSDNLFPLPSKFHQLKSLNPFPNPSFSQISPKTTHDRSALSPNSTNPTSTSTSTSSSNPNPKIRNLCLHGHLDQALVLLESSVEYPFDEDTYIALVRLCEWKRAVADGSRVYSHVSSSNTHLSVRLGNALLSMFVRFGNLLVAWSVFGKMMERDVFSWNVMVGGYGKAGFLDEALDLYQRMVWAGIRPDVYTFPCVLRSCGGIPDMRRGREVHTHVIRFYFGLEIDVLNALITMYAKCGDSINARKVFDGMLRRDCISWNAMISGYFANGEYIEGLGLFFTMWDLSLEPDLMTITSVVSACGSLGNKSLGKEIHGYAIKKNFVANVSVHNSLIQMYTSLGSMREAEKIFSRMESKDVVSWTAMISGYEKNASPEKALEVFELMEANNVSPDEVTIASVLAACACLGCLDIGVKLHELARSKGLMPYTIVGNTLLDMYSKSRCIDKAIEVFKRMPEKDVISWSSIISGFRINHRSFEALSFFRLMQADVKPNSITFIAALAACAAVGALSCGREIHAQALRNGLGSKGYLANALLDLYVKCGRTEYAWIQFNLLGEKDVVSWNIMLTGYAGRGHGDLAVVLFSRMVEAGVHPDEVTFVAILCACSRSGMVSQGWDFFNSMTQKYSIIPNLRHYACMVDLLGRAGFLEEAHNFIKDLPIEPDAAIWGALLNGCRIHRNIELGELAAKSIFQLESETVGYYVLLCNLYVDGGRWDQVARVRKVMREKGLEVDPGCSWIEVKGTVHAFLSADESHPQIKEINAILNGLYERMKAVGLVPPQDGSLDEIEASKADIFCGHSERLAVAFGLINSIPGTPIWVTKNLYMCQSCHRTLKFISKIVRRDITVRDTEQFHNFKDGNCSCGDEGYW